MIEPAEAERYRLSREENERIFHQRIGPRLLQGRASQETQRRSPRARTPSSSRTWIAVRYAEIIVYAAHDGDSTLLLHEVRREP
ncbi:hypothetical protein SUDANB99_05966 (plasmid) [Streptomyces sp. enrichment culture]